jgi:hypothetical protein
MIATQTGASCNVGRWFEGDVRVFVGRGCVAAAAALTVVFGLCGCSDGSTQYFSKPLNPFGSNLGYSYSQLDQGRQDRPLTEGDLVDANGGCPRYAPPAPAAPPPTPPPGTPDGVAAPPDPSLLGGGIALGMSECDVVSRLGQPTAVNIGASPNGLRNTVLTFNAGPRPGVYRFNSGRLAEMDRVAEPSAPPVAQKKITKKKLKKDPANASQPSAAGNKT